MMKITHKVNIMLYEFLKRTYDVLKHQYIFTEVSKFLKSRVKVTQTQHYWETRKIDLRFCSKMLSLSSSEDIVGLVHFGHCQNKSLWGRTERKTLFGILKIWIPIFCPYWFQVSDASLVTPYCMVERFVVGGEGAFSLLLSLFVPRYTFSWSQIKLRQLWCHGW